MLTMTKDPAPNKTPAIMSLLSSNAEMTDQAIADVVGVKPQRVGQVRRSMFGPRPVGRPAKVELVHTRVRIQSYAQDLADAAGQNLSEYIRTLIDKAKEESK